MPFFWRCSALPSTDTQWRQPGEDFQFAEHDPKLALCLEPSQVNVTTTKFTRTVSPLLNCCLKSGLHILICLGCPSPYSFVVGVVFSLQLSYKSLIMFTAYRLILVFYKKKKKYFGVMMFVLQMFFKWLIIGLGTKQCWNTDPTAVFVLDPEKSDPRPLPLWTESGDTTCCDIARLTELFLLLSQLPAQLPQFPKTTLNYSLVIYLVPSCLALWLLAHGLGHLVGNTSFPKLTGIRNSCFGELKGLISSSGPHRGYLWPDSHNSSPCPRPLFFICGKRWILRIYLWARNASTAQRGQKGALEPRRWSYPPWWAIWYG